jgi:hypothetical protein
MTTLTSQKSFSQLLNEAIADKILPPFGWYLVPSYNKSTGQFVAAVIVQGREWSNAVQAALKLRCNEGEELGRTVEIPADRVPAEQYRNRSLTREEVETILPTANQGK